MQADEFLLLADQLPEGMLLLSADGAILTANRAAGRQLGQTPSQLSGQNIATLAGIAPDDLSKKLKPCARSRTPSPLALNNPDATAGITIPACEGFLVCPANDGQPAQLVVRFLGNASKTDTFHALNNELEKQRRVLKKLERSREQLRISQENLAITLNSIGDAVMVTDKHGMLVSLNPVAEQLTGWSNEASRGQSVKTIFPIIDASTRKPIENPVEKVLATGETVYLSNHTTLISKDGTEYQIADSAAPIREKHGSEILGMVLVFHDVTEQYRLREENIRSKHELELREKLYRDLIESTAAVAWEYDMTLQRFTYMGPRILELTGYPQERWVDFHSWADRIHPDDRERVTSYCQFETSQGLDHTIEYRNVTASGNTVWIRDEVTVITQDDKPVMMRGYFFDITEYKQTEEALRRAQKMDAVGQMAGGIAHDFNNIIGIVLGNLELLERQIDSDDRSLKRINSIKQASERAAILTNQLLGFSRREAISVKPTDISHILNEMDSLITQSLTPQVEVQCHCADALWNTDIDAGDFQDAILNLVLNARDAMDGRGKLTIETQNCILDDSYCSLNPGVAAGEYIQLAISDTGTGIPAEQQARIFEPFYTTKEQGKGTGLGLSMVFGFVQRSHGHIKVYSEPDLGTTFRMYLPRSTEQQAAAEVSHKTGVTLPTGMETILVVDDEPALLDLVKESLQELGYTVLTANNGIEALQILERSSDIKLLFSDVVMPGGVNGYELAEQAVTQHPELKVLLTSGYTEMAVARNGQARFNANFISKPYTQADLTQRIRERLDDDYD